MTQTRTLEQTVLYPVTRLLRQPLSLHSTGQNLGIFCNPCVRSTASLETGDNGNTLAEWHPFVSSCTGSVLVQASVSYKALWTTLRGLPGAPSGEHSCRLRLGQCLYALLSVCDNCLDNWHSPVSFPAEKAQVFIWKAGHWGVFLRLILRDYKALPKAH